MGSRGWRRRSRAMEGGAWLLALDGGTNGARRRGRRAMGLLASRREEARAAGPPGEGEEASGPGAPGAGVDRAREAARGEGKKKRDPVSFERERGDRGKRREWRRRTRGRGSEERLREVSARVRCGRSGLKRLGLEGGGGPKEGEGGLGRWEEGEEEAQRLAASSFLLDFADKNKREKRE